MRLFLETNHKLIVFLLLITVWTDLILPDPYKSSELVFWLFSLLLFSWYFLAYRILNKTSSVDNQQAKIGFYIALLLLVIAITLQALLGFDTAHIGDTNVAIWRLLCYGFLAFTVTRLLVSAEAGLLVSFKGLTTFLLVFLLPVGAWWIHQRIQRVAMANKLLTQL
ncbi:hypothetical protein J2I47_02505 [Fibrella sp. HMF5335]|uniref:Uncharacterized protein n=1 Tax=Fibrella rubiginis TaxID=2817060 RepID=A0A939K4H8_9BACT|nr:hypothetical protein [Fibrella rubiginis]MBO0935410.1 hypothetical protein [Fibrella rubiginis]